MPRLQQNAPIRLRRCAVAVGPLAHDSTQFASHFVGLEAVLDPVLRAEHSLKFNTELVATAVEGHILGSAP